MISALSDTIISKSSRDEVSHSLELLFSDTSGSSICNKQYVLTLTKHFMMMFCFDCKHHLETLKNAGCQTTKYDIWQPAQEPVPAIQFFLFILFLYFDNLQYIVIY
jgi:hypothetical protein